MRKEVLLMNNFKTVITASGRALPEDQVTNDVILKTIDSSNEWIETKIGVRERRFSNGKETSSSLAIKAAKQCIKNSSIDINSIDAIVMSVGCPDHFGSSAGVLVKRELGIKNCAVHDITSGCSGFIFALNIANSYIISGMYNRVLVIGTEILSMLLDKYDRSTYPYFGDGAGAVILEGRSGTNGFLNFYMGSDGGGNDVITISAGGVRNPATLNSIIRRDICLRMNAVAVWKFATKIFPYCVEQVLADTGYEVKDVDFIVSHQSNERMIKHCMDALNLPMEKTALNIQRYGNTASASVPILFSELIDNKNFKEGDLVVFVAFGAGLSFGAALYQF